MAPFLTVIWIPSELLLLLKLLLLLLVSVALDMLSEPALDVVLRLLLLLLVGTAFSKRWCPPDTGADAAFAFAGIAPDTGADAAFAVEAAAAVAHVRFFGRASGSSAGSCNGHAFGKAC